MNEIGFRKELSTVDLFCMGLGSTIGWGVWTQQADWFVMSGPVGTALGALLGALIILPQVLTYCKLINLFPKEGGCFRWSHEAFGRLASFFAGWYLLIAYVTIIILNVTAFSVWLKMLIPNLIEYRYIYSVGGYSIYLGWVIAATLVCILFVTINCRGVKFAGKFQTFVVIGILIGFLCFLLMAFMRGNPAFIIDPSVFSLKNGPSRSIILWVAIAPWAFCGLESVSQGFGEAKTVKVYKVWIPLLLFAVFIYSSIAIVTAMAKPWDQMTGEWLATATAARIFFGKVGVGLVTFSVLFAIVSGINGFIISSSRLLFSMADLELVPKIFSKIHPKYQTPCVAIQAIGLFVIITTFFGRGILTWFIDISAFGQASAFVFAGLSLCKLRNCFKLSKWNTLLGALSVMAGIFFLILLLTLKMALTGIIAIIAYTILGLVCFQIVSRGKKVRIRKGSRSYSEPERF